MPKNIYAPMDHRHRIDKYRGGRMDVCGCASYSLVGMFPVVSDYFIECCVHKLAQSNRVSYAQISRFRSYILNEKPSKLWFRPTLINAPSVLVFWGEGFGSAHYQQSETSDAVSATLCKSKQSTRTHYTDNNLQTSESTDTAVGYRTLVRRPTPRVLHFSRGHLTTTRTTCFLKEFNTDLLVWFLDSDSCHMKRDLIV